MRSELRDRVGRRGQFSGTVSRFGVRTYKGLTAATILFENVRDERGTLVSDHLWMRLSEGFAAHNPAPGDEFYFNARIKRYWKRNPVAGYYDDEPARIMDFKLSNPSGIRKLGAQVAQSLPLFDQAAAGNGGRA
jgi:hypothetical protein